MKMISISHIIFFFVVCDVNYSLEYKLFEIPWEIIFGILWQVFYPLANYGLPSWTKNYTLLLVWRLESPELLHVVNMNSKTTEMLAINNYRSS